MISSIEYDLMAALRAAGREHRRLCQALARLSVLDRRMILEATETLTPENVEDPGVGAEEHETALTTAASLLDEIDFQHCRHCGCSEHDACETAAGPCAWAEADLCSACAEPAGDDR